MIEIMKKMQKETIEVCFRKINKKVKSSMKI